MHILHPPRPFPLAQFPEPFQSTPPAITRRLPNVQGLLGAPLALAAMREAQAEARRLQDPHLLRELPQPLPGALAYRRDARLLHYGPAGQTGNEVHVLVKAYWAFGWQRGIYDLMPDTLKATSEGAPEWAEWFDAYARNGFQAPKAFWPHKPAQPKHIPRAKAHERARCTHGHYPVDCPTCGWQSGSRPTGT